MLGQRIITAVILLAIVAATLATGQPLWFLALLALAAACAAWEWLRLTLPPCLPPATPAAVAVGAFGAMIALAAAWAVGAGGMLHAAVGQVLAPLVALVWLLAATTAVVRGRADAPAGSPAWTLFAVPAIFTAWAVLARMFLEHGGLYVVSLLALVWVADIAAYFVGRAIGRHKLAPRVSPGKTIEGAAAGVLGAALWIALSAQWEGTYGHMLAQRWSLWGAVPLAMLLGVLSIVGDLFESLLKRRAGRKDSSALLPGHGGVYDRIDAIVPVAPVAFLMSGVLF
ncbi:phosphatidate cytidylyltransferase [Bordetella sp. 2513F-2]